MHGPVDGRPGRLSHIAAAPNAVDCGIEGIYKTGTQPKVAVIPASNAEVSVRSCICGTSYQYWSSSADGNPLNRKAAVFVLERVATVFSDECEETVGGQERALASQSVVP